MLVPFRDIIILALMIARVGTILQLGWYELLNLLCMYLQKLNDYVHRLVQVLLSVVFSCR